MYLIKDLFGEAALRRAFGDDCLTGCGIDRTAWAPAFGVEEKDHEIELTGELPGLTHDDIEVNLENNVLTVSGEKRFVRDERAEGTEGTEGKRHLMERRFGRFNRSFALPRTVQAEGITADFENGILTVRLPKADEARTRKIEVRTSA